MTQEQYDAIRKAEKHLANAYAQLVMARPPGPQNTVIDDALSTVRGLVVGSGLQQKIWDANARRALTGWLPEDDEVQS